MSGVFLGRPRLLLLAVLLICAAGINAYRALPRAEDPELTSRDAIVLTPFPGAGAERIEALVTDRLEDALREIAEIRTFDSDSGTDMSMLHIEVREELTDTAPIWSRVRDKLQDAQGLLPEGAGPVDFQVFDISAFTLITALVPAGDTPADMTALTRRAEDLADRLRAVPGTKDVDLYGEQLQEVQVDLDRDELLRRGLTLEQVAAAVRREDSKTQAGVVHTGRNDLVLDVHSDLETLEHIGAIPVRPAPGGSPTTLADLGEVRRGEHWPPRDYAMTLGQRAVLVAARMRTGKRVDEWSAAANRALAEYARELPRGMVLHTLFDQNRYTHERLSALQRNFGLGALLVMAVVFLTMGWRSSLMVGLTLPLAVLLALAGMQYFEVPMHQMSVAGLIIALGLLIDNAIVMVDELSHRLAEGQGPRAAARGAMAKLGLPLFCSTATTALAFMPILLMPGAAGEFVGSMALCVILAIGSSLLLSFVVLPPVAVAFLAKGPRKQGLGMLDHGISVGPLERTYSASIGFLVRHPWLAIAVGLVLPVLAATRIPTLQEQFFPPADRDQFGIEMHLPSVASMEQSIELSQRTRETLLQHPRVREVSWVTGTNFPKFYYNQIEDRAGAPYFSQALVQLDRPEDSLQVVRELQDLLDREHPEAYALVRQIEQGPPFEAPVEIRLTGPGLETLRRMGQIVQAELNQVEHVLHTRLSLLGGRPTLALQPRGEELLWAGSGARSLGLHLRANLSGAAAGSLLEGTEELPVMLRLAGEQRDGAGDLDQLALSQGPDR
ncbi:MAG: efflux RND transporter permease subunit [Planctomycetota bacterium]